MKKLIRELQSQIHTLYCQKKSLQLMLENKVGTEDMQHTIDIQKDIIEAHVREISSRDSRIYGLIEQVDQEHKQHMETRRELETYAKQLAKVTTSRDQLQHEYTMLQKWAMARMTRDVRLWEI